MQWQYAINQYRTRGPVPGGQFSRDLAYVASGIQSTHKIGTSISPNNQSKQGTLRVAYNLLRINNTNSMVTMSREPIEKSCSSKQFQYSQETIETLQNIMREVASKMERPNVSTIKRRKLTGWNIFTKRKSLESMLQREFVNDNEFIGYVIDNKEFKYQSKAERHRNRRRIRMNVGVADKLSTGSIRKEFNNLTLDKRYFYDELANALTKLRDEDEQDKKVVCGI